MKSGKIPLHEIEGGVDLKRTLESGQTFLWRRTDGDFFTGKNLPEGEWYYTTTDEELLKVRQTDTHLIWEGTVGEKTLWERLRLHDSLTDIYSHVEDPLAQKAFSYSPQIRLVNDPFEPCLFSFITSSNMNVKRIHKIQTKLSENFGSTLKAGGETFSVYPTPTEIASSSPQELKEKAKLGYRSEWVYKTAETLEDNNKVMGGSENKSLQSSKSDLLKYTGVGDKVADCVLLYSLGFEEVVPIDTWIKKVVEEEYNDCDSKSYETISQCLQEKWAPHPGYTQLYVFDYIRRNENKKD